jgi:hypothetical protein
MVVHHEVDSIAGKRSIRRVNRGVWRWVVVIVGCSELERIGWRSVLDVMASNGSRRVQIAIRTRSLF